MPDRTRINQISAVNKIIDSQSKRLNKMRWNRRAIFAAFIFLVSCTDAHQGNVGSNWPDGLDVIGYGFPETGDACRQLQSSAIFYGKVDGPHLFVGCPETVSEDLMKRISQSYLIKDIMTYEGIKILAIPLQ